MTYANCEDVLLSNMMPADFPNEISLLSEVSDTDFAGLSTAPSSVPMPIQKRGQVFPCPWEGCGKSFNKKYNMQMHMRQHTNERPYVCSVNDCRLSFKWRSSLRNHLRYHFADGVVPKELLSLPGRSRKPGPKAVIAKQPTKELPVPSFDIMEQNIGELPNGRQITSKQAMLNFEEVMASPVKMEDLLRGPAPNMYDSSADKFRL
uniref:C2H2-type domain-containing protein n=1 Tax=Rhodosorus marinus TaxID=101924 RepID=A0A7S0BPB0_9RHOD|mmetsp:Transcript_24522/g.35383  ORF Transcript_24522/g.35383 Transcript_24522/m.35383 type:complete len:205 (+) Transcript_24522:57-671(+)|eukprot:CAMPEP_0184737394 /NCGR_PEP_ID=MMETSP0315-20130426/192_1 /TAXON_ID=101924 /ORGANISM="Rhodosorus marinus, Strain UTEX LB 2760" /LENGTH=204 /DNA_ID=CAMNT_0027204575 /DNA_START=43 /DNA_END=657 /DNA_ORIENTATION=+